MSLPSPNLDDRTWEDIVEEAKKRIPALCPQWTDFNPSDPGITLVELMAWMTEMLIYRLNRVPDKNYVKFLELIGVTLTPPRPATTWMQFFVSEGASDENLPTIPPQTKISGTDDSGQPIIFETTETLNLSASRLVKIYSQVKELYTDRTQDLITGLLSSKFNLFEGKTHIDHLFYLGTPDINLVGNDFSLRFYVSLEAPGLDLNLQWSCWDGKKWLDISPAVDETNRLMKDGQILFTHLPEAVEKEINGVRSLWFRLKLDKYRDAPLPKIKKLQKCLELKKEAGIMPAAGFFSSEDIPYMPIVFQGVIMPFGRDGKVNDSMYLSSDVFMEKGISVTINFQLADSYTPGTFDTLEDLVVKWEYYSQSGKWASLGTTTLAGVTESNWAFSDDTDAFTRSGKVAFHVPEDIAPLELYGETRCWVRTYIAAGDYDEKKKKSSHMPQRIDVL